MPRLSVSAIKQEKLPEEELGNEVGTSTLDLRYFPSLASQLPTYVILQVALS